MTSAIPKLANSELVASAWLRKATLAHSPGVGAILQGPADDGTITWSDSGFIQFATVGSGKMGDIPLRQPVVSVDVWGIYPGRAKAPWARTAGLAEILVRATLEYDWGVVHGPVTLPAGFPGVSVIYAEALNSEPERRPADEANMAHYGFQLALAWVELPA